MKPFIYYIKPLWLPAVIVSFLSLLTVAGTLYIPTLTASIINDGVLKGDLEMIANSSMNMLVVALLTVLSAILGVAMSAHISASVGKVLRDDLVKALQYFTPRLYALWYWHHIDAHKPGRRKNSVGPRRRIKYDSPYADYDMCWPRSYLLQKLATRARHPRRNGLYDTHHYLY